MHHIISDGGPTGIDKGMFHSIKMYIGVAEFLFTLNIQYKDYAVWQQQQLENDSETTQGLLA